MKESTKQAIAATLKSEDTEEFLDIYFYRPVGYWWALFFKKLKIHPNVVTLFSIVMGCTAGLLFCSPHLSLNVVGMFLLVWANSYDSADGQLARITGQKTRWGRILDGFAGDTWFFFINFSVCAREVFHCIPGTQQQWGALIFVVASYSGFIFHTKQSRLADYYRNVHLFFLKGKSGSELDTSEQQQKIFEQASWRHEFFWKLFMNSYVGYTRAQEQDSPALQRFLAIVRERYGSDIPQSLRDAFRRGSLPLMKYTNILTFNTRCIILFCCMFIDTMWLYFFFEIVVFSLLFLYMNVRHERFCRQLTQRLLDHEFDS